MIEQFWELIMNEPGGIYGKLADILLHTIDSVWFEDNDGKYVGIPEAFAADLSAKVMLYIQREENAFIEEYLKTGGMPILWQEAENKTTEMLKEWAVLKKGSTK